MLKKWEHSRRFFFKSRKNYICELTFKFSSLTNFPNRNVETDVFFMIAKTKLFRSNKIIIQKTNLEILSLTIFIRILRQTLIREIPSIIITIKKDRLSLE